MLWPERINRIPAVLLAFLVAGTFHYQHCHSKEIGDPEIGHAVANFTLQDFRGKPYSLGKVTSRYIVVAFLGTECPLAKLYARRLNNLSKAFPKKSVAFIGIDSNTQDSMTEIAAFARVHDLHFPLLKDPGNIVADQLRSQRTPEVFVLDEQRKVQYWGRIDDQYGIGFSRDKPRREDLKVALQELLQGKPVSHPIEASVGCLIGRVQTPREDSPVTYSNQIARILQDNCVQCHRAGDIAPFALTQYDEVVGWSDTIAEVVREQRMPPWHADPQFGHFSNDRSLTGEEREMIFTWVRAGSPEGDQSNAPKPKDRVQGWQLPRNPDLVVPIHEHPFQVQAEGTVRYEYIKVELDFSEDKWLAGIEVLPGNRSVIHHILAFAIPTDGSRREFHGGARGFLAGYVPGMRAEPYPPGMAKKLSANSDLLFQMHYTPIGSVQEDSSKVGFLFADPGNVTYEVRTISAFQPFIKVPKNVANHQETTSTRIRQPSQLLGLMPHMHVRGRSFRYLAMFPGRKQWTTLLNVPSYDFNWQTNYRFQNPLDLPTDTRIKCVAHYDNSETNLNNPNPDKTVRWGEQTWEEMLIGYMDIAVPKHSSTRLTTAERQIQIRAEELLMQLDKNDNNHVDGSELPLRTRLLMIRADKNNDGKLSLNEVVQVFNRGRG